MAENSKIEWTDHTFNPWIGCAKVSAGCANCYAETLMDKRYGRVQWGVNGTRSRTSGANWRKPLAWNKAAEEAGRPQFVFCASLADVFEDRPELAPWRRDLFGLIERTPHLVWLLLTKRPENIQRMISDMVNYDAWVRGHQYVWFGTSVENQEQARARIPALIDIPATRFLSCEPLLGPLNLSPYLRHISWVIVGGESGRGHRPIHAEWVRDIRDQCVWDNVEFFFKQWGGVRPAATGRLLDGQEWSFRPDPAAVA